MDNEKKTYGLHWFRRDLRIAGNENLRLNWKRNQGAVVGIFCFDSSFLKRSDFSHNRFAFFLKTIKELKQELQLQGGDLLVVDEQPHLAFPKIFEYLKKNKQGLPSCISYGRDYEPFARLRDEKMAHIFHSSGLEIINERDHLLLEPWEVTKEDASFYQVYSPFARRWFEKLGTAEIQGRLQQYKNTESYFKRLQNQHTEQVFKLKWGELATTPDFPYVDSLDLFEKENNKNVTITIPEAGFSTAFKRLTRFSKNLNEYKTQRDIPSLDATSQMSVFLKNGSITSSQILSALKLSDQADFKNADGRTQYLKEIVWREFYYAILYYRPNVEEKSFLPQYENLKWSNQKEWFERWCAGETGFPIVDAGMRQLMQTGWMHNRVRMIVASFLVKDLLIDWRWGENYFMKTLLDGDLAPNNGGWQWAASTGCDPQPYFRIFNPWLQGAKFDPDASYIKHFVPELKNVSAELIHDPDSGRKSADYPLPMVDHAQQKEKALALFKAAASK